MDGFQLPEDLHFNRGRVADPNNYAQEVGCASWLYLNGEEFASTEGGISFSQVQTSVEHAVNVISDPPRVLNIELARQHVAALDDLPRPTLITCRTGPRASAVAYMYAGLLAGTDPVDVIASAEENDAPFCRFDEYRKWVVESIETLRAERD